MEKYVPVVVIKELSETDKILTALKNNGINTAEITFRTACAAEAIAYACKNYPDMSIGAGTVTMPFGGKNQLTPSQAMVNLVSVEKKHTDTVSFMAWGGNPFVMEKSPYHGAYLAVVESVSKLIATGAEFKDVYLTFQEYFKRLGKDASRWGEPVSALLGAYKAQIELKCAAIGGKDSMSGTFENIDVPPTLVSFAVTTGKVDEVVTPEFKKAGSKVCFLLFS